MAQSQSESQAGHLAVTSPEGLIPAEHPLVTLAEKWQRQMGAQPDAAAVSKMVADRLLGLFNSMAYNANGQHPHPAGFDMTPRSGVSPIDDAFFFRVGYREQDRPAALNALHDVLGMVADRGVVVPNGGRVLRQDTRILLMPGAPAPLKTDEKPFTRATTVRLSNIPKTK